MSDEFYQCCYTNDEVDVGGSVRSGWRAVAVSPDIPHDVMDACVNFQSANSDIREVMRDSQGNALSLYEVFGDWDHVYTMRSQYGLLDRLGRPNMFSHAIVLTWEGSGALLDPNVFLSIDSANYKDNKTDAEVLTPPLLRSEPMTLQYALDEMDMGKEELVTLVRCVYAVATSDDLAKPLYIAYDGSERQRRCLLYCLYWSLPPFLRRTLSVASAAGNNAQRTDVVLSTAAMGRRYHLDPKTGQNSVLDQRMLDKIARQRFVDYAVMHLSERDVPVYFSRLEHVAGELSGHAQHDALMQRVAHSIVADGNLSDMSTETLGQILEDAIAVSRQRAPRALKHTAALLREVERRKLQLTPKIEDELVALFERVGGESFLYEPDGLGAVCLDLLSPEAAAVCLASADNATVRLCTDRLAKSERGQMVLDSYYANVVLCRAEPSWGLLNSALDATNLYVSRARTLARVDQLATQLYRNALRNLPGIAKDYEAYCKLMNRMFTSQQASDRSAAARSAYWTNMRFGMYQNCPEETNHILADGSARMEALKGFSMGLQDVRQASDPEQLLTMTQRVFCMYRSQLARESDYADAVEALGMSAQNNEAVLRADFLIAFWARAIALAPVAETARQGIELRRALYANMDDAFLSAYERYRNACGAEGGFAVRACGVVAEAVCRYALAIEAADSERVVPLDVWLVAGADLYQNPFMVFDAVDAAVLRAAKPRAYVAASRLLVDPTVRQSAQFYVQTNGRAVANVQSWLSTLEHIERVDNLSLRRLWNTKG